MYIILRYGRSHEKALSIYSKKRQIKCTKNKLRCTNANFTRNNDYGHTS
jgi:hypothetical protein